MNDDEDSETVKEKNIDDDDDDDAFLCDLEELLHSSSNSIKSYFFDAFIFPYRNLTLGC